MNRQEGRQQALLELARSAMSPSEFAAVASRSADELAALLVSRLQGGSQPNG